MPPANFTFLLVPGASIRNNRVMDLRHLKTLIAIVEHRSFAAAADAIGLTQSAVSLHVKALEDDMQMTLFDRSTRPPLLNSQGAALVERAREIIALCDGLTDSLRGDRVTGVLDLGAVPTALTGMLPGALATLQAAQPELRIRVSSGLSNELADEVRKGVLDAAIVSEPAQLAAGLSWHPVIQEPLMVIAPVGTPGRKDRDLLAALPFIRFKRFAWAGRLIDTHLRERGIHLMPGMEMDSLEAIGAMVAHGLGVSIAPQRAMAAPFPNGVRAVPFGTPPLTRGVGIVERTESPKSDLVRALYDVLLQT